MRRWRLPCCHTGSRELQSTTAGSQRSHLWRLSSTFVYVGPVIKVCHIPGTGLLVGFESNCSHAERISCLHRELRPGLRWAAEYAPCQRWSTKEQRTTGPRCGLRDECSGSIAVWTGRMGNEEKNRFITSARGPRLAVLQCWGAKHTVMQHNKVQKTVSRC